MGLVVLQNNDCLVQQEWSFLVGEEFNVADGFAVVDGGWIVDWEYCSGGDVRAFFDSAESVDGEAFFDMG